MKTDKRIITVIGLLIVNGGMGPMILHLESGLPILFVVFLAVLADISIIKWYEEA